MATEKSEARFLENPLGESEEGLPDIDVKNLRAPLENVRIAVSIVQHEIDRLQKRSQNNFLDIVEAKLLRDYILLLLQLHKEKIFPELMKQEDFDPEDVDLDDIGEEELANLTLSAAKKVGFGLELSTGILRTPNEPKKE